MPDCCRGLARCHALGWVHKLRPGGRRWDDASRRRQKGAKAESSRHWQCPGTTFRRGGFSPRPGSPAPEQGAQREVVVYTQRARRGRPPPWRPGAALAVRLMPGGADSPAIMAMASIWRHGPHGTPREEELPLDIPADMEAVIPPARKTPFSYLEVTARLEKAAEWRGPPGGPAENCVSANLEGAMTSAARLGRGWPGGGGHTSRNWN